MGVVFKFFGIAFAIVLFLYLIANILRSSRRLDKRIATLKKEQEENAKQGKIINPYAALAELYTESATQEDAKPRRKRRG